MCNSAVKEPAKIEMHTISKRMLTGMHFDFITKFAIKNATEIAKVALHFRIGHITPLRHGTSKQWQTKPAGSKVCQFWVRCSELDSSCQAKKPGPCRGGDCA
jgi:hypothetical protein